MALATRCPFCETVFRLDPHLLAPHDGRVRCGHCQEVFDAAHFQFERDETVMAALAATAPKYDDKNAPAPNYGRDDASPWASPSKAEVSDDKRTALGIPLHPFISDAALAPQAKPAESTTNPAPETQQARFAVPLSPPEVTPPRASGEADAPAESTLSGEAPPAALLAAELASRTRAESEFPGQSLAESPWESARHAQADAEIRAHEAAMAQADARAREKELAEEQARDRAIANARRREQERAEALAREQALNEARIQEQARQPFQSEPRGEARTDPFIGGMASDRGQGNRAEPFVSRTQPDPLIDEDATLTPAPSDPWHADAEPRFGAAPELDTPLPPPPPEPFPVTREVRPPARSGMAWKIIGGLLALVLIITLLAQLAWWQRETVMVYWPRSQTLFAQACDQIGCVVAPPRDIDALQIENSGLRQVDGSHKLELKLTLRNRFDLSIAYPALELTLLDDKNNVAIRRVLWPQDYARPGTPLGSGLPARSTQPVIVRLDTGEAVAANYRVQIFYP